MTDRGKPPEGAIEKKVLWAEECCRLYKKSLLEDRSIMDLLKELAMAIETSHRILLGTGITEICRVCDQDQGGSCCGIGIENYYSGTLLLLNLLMGADLPKKRNSPSDCFFLSPKGCRLPARHVLCVNYICEEIETRIEPSKIHVLREKEGIELNLIFSLYERIHKILEEKRKGE